MFLPPNPTLPLRRDGNRNHNHQTKALALLSAAKIPNSDAWSWQPFINSTSSWRSEWRIFAPQKNGDMASKISWQLEVGNFRTLHPGMGKKWDKRSWQVEVCIFVTFPEDFGKFTRNFVDFFVFDLKNWNRWRLRTFRKITGKKTAGGSWAFVWKLCHWETLANPRLGVDFGRFCEAKKLQ